jgi:hypothetical protein
MPVVGFLSPSRPGGILGMEAFFEGLKEGGYVDGRNAVIEYRWAGGRNDLLPMLAAVLNMNRCQSRLALRGSEVLRLNDAVDCDHDLLARPRRLGGSRLR